jgi:RHS repeat-associated protein
MDRGRDGTIEPAPEGDREGLTDQVSTDRELGTVQYLPSNGEFISEDPVGEQFISTNLYEYAGNSPLNFTDPWGLSPADVAKIRATFASAVADLTLKGQRYPNPYVNNASRFVNLITLGLLGHRYLGCGEQAAEVFFALTGNDYDDKWIFDEQFAWQPGPHRFLRAVSSNPNDPVLIVDPWRNDISEGK